MTPNTRQTDRTREMILEQIVNLQDVMWRTQQDHRREMDLLRSRIANLESDLRALDGQQWQPTI